MEIMSQKLLYHKQPLNDKGRPYFNDGKWSLPSQKQLIPRMKRRSLNPIKIKQIYQLKVKDQQMILRHQKSEQIRTEANNQNNRSVYMKSESKQLKPTLTKNIRIRSNSINNGSYINMQNKAKYDMKYMHRNNHSFMNLSDF